MQYDACKAAANMHKNPFDLVEYEMGNSLIENLKARTQDPAFPGYLQVHGIPNPMLALKVIQETVQARGSNQTQIPDSAMMSLKYQASEAGGAVFLCHQSEQDLFELPNLTAPLDAPSHKDISTFLARLAQDPLKGSVAYYVGALLADHYLGLLDAGDLSSLGTIQGITTEFWHVGDAFSGTAFHCEDAMMRSCNLILHGYKLWILIDVLSIVIFEAYVHKFCIAKDGYLCDQWVHHVSVLLDSNVLDKEYIEYRLICAGPGCLVVTAPR